MADGHSAVGTARSDVTGLRATGVGIIGRAKRTLLFTGAFPRTGAAAFLGAVRSATGRTVVVFLTADLVVTFRAGARPVPFATAFLLAERLMGARLDADFFVATFLDAAFLGTERFVAVLEETDLFTLFFAAGTFATAFLAVGLRAGPFLAAFFAVVLFAATLRPDPLGTAFIVLLRGALFFAMIVDVSGWDRVMRSNATLRSEEERRGS